ncbi:hypothetical protein DPMN_175362 [Dreissena polymorpha]|uniref:Uncharacterized protein n=1 Tax=Dreissena polymorpha TaxID=45954 RepID=A0A9D4IFZ3_DREPO|nr:hypothetical protein DPMN_175362 [Dreissena polymorpha]
MARQRPTRLVMGPCIVEIDRIVIREVQYQLEVNRCRNVEIIVKGNIGWAWPMWAWPMWAGRPRIDRIVIMNRLKGNFGWAWPMWACPMWAGCPRIDRIVIREVQYQFEVNRCRNREIIAWPMWPGRPRIDCIVIREAQYQFEFQGSSATSVGGAGGQDGRTDRRTLPQYPDFFSEKRGDN